jgi:hypothetical protein
VADGEVGWMTFTGAAIEAAGAVYEGRGGWMSSGTSILLLVAESVVAGTFAGTFAGAAGHEG